MTTLEFLFESWHWNLFAIVIAALLSLFHIVTNGYKLRNKSINFFGGIILLLLSTLSPLDYLGSNYLFSAHMVEHILLLLVIPPLLLTGTNKEFLEKFFEKDKLNKIGKVIFNPLISWFLGVGSMWFWHVPYLFRLMKLYPAVHLIQMLSLLILGIIFIWPVFTPARFKKISALQSTLYLFSACVGCTILGILITFAPPGLYTLYYTGNNSAVLSLIQNKWGISHEIDQQMGGLIMWVPACFVYLTNIMISLFNWYKEPEFENSDEILLHKG
jgi:putative membrane protein